jgi:hypothetical protein
MNHIARDFFLIVMSNMVNVQFKVSQSQVQISNLTSRLYPPIYYIHM